MLGLKVLFLDKALREQDMQVASYRFIKELFFKGPLPWERDKGMVAYTCHLSNGKMRQENHEFRASLGYK